MTVQLTAVFIAEASIAIGAGHVVRCRVLADALSRAGWQCYWSTSATTQTFLGTVLEPYKNIKPESWYQTNGVFDLMVIDRYDFDQRQERQLRQFTRKLLVIDDLANRMHDCDGILDQTLGRQVSDYARYLPEHCRCFIGFEYALVRQTFLDARQEIIKRRKTQHQVQRVVMSLGGSDPHGHTARLVQKLITLGYSGQLSCVLGFSAEQQSEVTRLLQQSQMQWTTHCNADMLSLYKQADLAIGAAGTSSWERICLGLPCVTIKTADNQETIFAELQQRELIFSEDELGFALTTPPSAYNKTLLHFSRQVSSSLPQLLEWINHEN